MNILGIKLIGHDTGAALIADGRIVAIAEERLNRIKHSRNMFPKMAIDYCLGAFNLKPADIDLVVMDQIGSRNKINIKQIFDNNTGNRFSNADIRVINHHDAHAASAFFCSPFERTAILIIDGAGEKVATHLGVEATETETLYWGKDNRFYKIQKTAHMRDGSVFPYTFGAGKLYQLLSERYLGFGHYNEGKMMGLASYGNDAFLKQFPFERWFCEFGGHLLCNARIRFPEGGNAVHQSFLASSLTRLKYAVRDALTRLGSFLVSKGNRLRQENFFRPLFFEKLILPRPPRDERCSLPDDYYAAVAYAGQQILERFLVKLASRLKNITNDRFLCVAGGLGLNIDANKKFLDEVGFEHIFVQPGASDTGIALGCALYGWHVILNKPRFWQMANASLGRVYGEGEILSLLKKHKNSISFRKSDDIARETARLITDGNIIGWFHGGAEYGPRALGNRSILCDASRIDMKDILNKKVKHREHWRPFAASVLVEHMPEWFELNEPSPFMLLSAPVRQEKRKLIPSVVHVDGTCRIQSVEASTNKRYYNLIKEFYKLTGMPLILNTSFNLTGDPIVETPKDAVDTFLKTKMDYLVLENYLVSKKNTFVCTFQSHQYSNA